MFKDAYDIYEESQNLFTKDILLKAAQGENNNFFVRNRKMNHVDVIKYIISSIDERNQKIKCLKYNLKREDSMNITNQGINFQRLKLNPEALKMVYKDFVRIVYSKHNYERTLQAKGYYVLAIDGTDLILPTNEETKEIYGGNLDANRNINQAMASASCAYDVLNRHIISATMHPYKTSEIDMATINIKESIELIPNDKKIFVFDRGYISLKLIITLLKSQNNFIFRLKKKDYKEEINSMRSKDELITIYMTKERINSMKHMPYYEEMLTVDHIVLRCVKLTLSSGEEEILLTNLENTEFTTEEIAHLYKLRWEIETVYNALKHKINIENFSGYKPIILEQDFYACIHLWNLMQNIILDERREIKDESEENHIYEMKINDSVAIGVLKEKIIELLYKEDKRKIFDEIVKAIVKNIEPIRPNRYFERKKKERSPYNKEIARRSRAKRKQRYNK